MLLPLLIFQGCFDSGEKDKKAVAIIDYLEIQDKVGISEMNVNKLAAFDKQRDNELSALLVALREQAAPLEAEIKDGMDQKRLEEIRAALGQLNQQFSTAQQQWATKREGYIKKLGDNIREALYPAMQKVCERNGFTLMLIRSNQEGYVDPSIEMTDEVIDEWKSNPLYPKDN